MSDTASDPTVPASPDRAPWASGAGPSGPPRQAPPFLAAAMRVFDLSLGQMLWSRRTIFLGLGAIALIGLPELLREVSEYRYLFYGAALIVMMIAKPDGLWPSTATKRELHHADAENVTAESMV